MLRGVTTFTKVYSLGSEVHIHRITESRNNRMVQVRTDHSETSDATSLLKRGYPRAHCMELPPDSSEISPFRE